MKCWVARFVGALTLVIVVSGCALDDTAYIAVQRPIDAPAGLDILFGHCGPDSSTDIGTDRLTDIDVRVESDPATTTVPTFLDADGVEQTVPDFGRTRFDRIVWSVHAAEPSALDSVRVGTAPPGFSTVIPLEEPLPERLLVVVRSAAGTGSARADRGVAELSVLLSNVPADGTFVLDEAGTTTLDEFRERVRTDECDEAQTESGRSSFGSTVSSLMVRLLVLTGGFLALIAAVLIWRRRRPADEPEPEPDEPEEFDDAVDGGSPP